MIQFDPVSGAVNFRGRLSSSNMAAVALMHRELPPSAQATMTNKAAQLKQGRELKHLRIKLNEAEDRNATAVEIIGNLQREREDIMTQNERMATELQAVQTELKILEQKNKSLEETYREETTKFMEDAAFKEKRITMIQEEINHKALELKDAKEYQKELKKQLTDVSSINEDSESGLTPTASSYQVMQLQSQLAAERQKVQEKDGQIDKMLNQVQGMAAVKHQKEELERELQNLETMAKEDVGLQNIQIEKMQREIISLASRNSKLEREKEDLIAMLEERDYENQMLKTGFGLHREKTARARGGSNQFNMQDFPTDQDIAPDEYDEEMDNLETLAFIDNSSHQPSLRYEDGDYLEREASIISGSSSPTAKVQQREAPDVTREYLHLTASVVNMKFARIKHIESEELIKQVKNYQFWEYHDMMVNIMRMEEQKMQKEEEAKREEEKRRRMQNGQQQQEQSSGMLTSFRNFFTGGNRTKKAMANQSKVSNQSKTPKGTSWKGGKGHQQRNSMTPVGTSNPMQPNLRERGATYDEADHPVDVLAKKTKQGLNKGKQATKNMAKKAKQTGIGVKNTVTGRPSEREMEQQSDMQFQGVPALKSPFNESPDSNEEAMLDVLEPKDKQKKMKKPKDQL